MTGNYLKCNGILCSNEPASTRFWGLYKRIMNDKNKVGVLINKSRSKMIEHLLSLVLEGAIKFDDLMEFSDGLQEEVKYLLNIKE